MNKPLLVLTPLALELRLLQESLRDFAKPCETRGRGALSLSLYEDLNLGLALGGHGKVQFAIHAQHWLSTENWRGLVCAGCAGSLSPEVKRLDLVVGETSVEHDHIEKFTGSPRPEFRSDSALLAEWRRKKASGYSIHFGRIASGDEDVVGAVRAREIRDATGALCVAWEGAGGARAARFLNQAYLEVRAITDHANSEAPKDFRESLRAAMGHIGKALAVS